MNVTLEQLQESARQADLKREAFSLGRKLARVDQSLLKVTLLGQCTLDYLAPTLGVHSLTTDLPLQVRCGGYDQVLQDLSSLEDGIVVLFPWNKRLLSTGQAEAELGFWQTCWNLAAQRGLKVVQVSYDWVRAGPYGHSSAALDAVARVRELNLALRERLPGGAFFLDLELVSAQMGKETFYDARSGYWTKQPFSQDGLALLARHLWAGVKALTHGPRKVLVVDLDNTLWGGVVGELGAAEVILDGPEGAPYLAFQSYLKTLAERGVLLAIASKNDKELALEALDTNRLEVLRSKDFVAFQIHWEPKSESLKRIAQELNLGLDSLVFFDDNPRERGEVSQVLPEVAVVPASEDSVDYIDDLERGLYFEFVELTEEDRQRTRSYQAQAQRAQAAETVEDYLDYLEMKATIAPIDEESLARATQLVARTNQFNLTTRRHSRADLERMAAVPGSYAKTLQLSDRFGDLGIISVIVALPEGEELRIDTWLMSCRALQRTVEHRFFLDLMEFAREAGYKRLCGEYLPTAKNRVVSQLYPQLGFVPEDSGVFTLELEGEPSILTHVG